ncbi:hypothetical protein IPJ70_03730 [Candidatus Campbellbacteria bacterium]|nr:MAG: hypothetical protein IPJ70_03730 [Candidatus Campbellbacteria bacterium]
MKKYISLLAGALIVGAFFVQPVRAETNLGSLATLIQSLMAQVQELQKQLAVLQNNTGSQGDSGIPGDDPIIQVVSPDGGEEFKMNSIEKIEWTYSPLPPSNFAINLLKSDGSEAVAHIRYCDSSEYFQDNYPNADHFWFNWKVGYDASGAKIPNGSYRIRVSNCGDVNDMSDSSFKIARGSAITKETITVTNPVGGERYIPGQAIPLTFEVKSSDGTPDVAIRVLQHTEGKDLVVNEAYYLYEDGFIKNGKNTLDFYPAKGSSYPTEKLVGEFRLELSVGKISCCKWWIEPTDSDITGWFKISYDKATDKDPYELSSKVLGASTSYQDVLSQMTNTLKGMQGFLQGLK